MLRLKRKRKCRICGCGSFGRKKLQKNLRMREFRKKEVAKAKKHAKEEYYKGSVFPDALRIAIVYGIIAFAASCFMWHDFAMKLVSPGWGWFLLLAGCIIVLALKVLMIFDPVPDASNHIDASNHADDFKHVDDSKHVDAFKHVPRSIVALSTSILIIAALFVQILAAFAHFPYGMSVLKHRDIYAEYEKAVKTEMEKLSEESCRPLELTARYEFESLKEKAESNLRYLDKWRCPKCHSCPQFEMSFHPFVKGCLSVKEGYETDLMILHWMCWLGTGFALLGYVLAYFRRRKDLLR